MRPDPIRNAPVASAGAFLLSGLIALTLPAPALAEALRPTVEVRAEALAPGIYYVAGQAGAASAANQGFMSNAGFVVTGDGVVVFDALGTPALARELLKRIAEVSTAPIRRLVISHFHPDHFYGAGVFREAGAQVWAHRAAAAYLASPRAAERLAERRATLAPWLDELGQAPSPDHFVDGETAFELGGRRFRIIPVGPAHTEEDLALLVEPDGVLFAGDLLFTGRLPFVGTMDSSSWLASLDRLLALRPRTIVTGHGRHGADAEDTLRFTRDYLIYLRRTMRDAVDNFVPFDEAYAATDWSAYEKLPAFREGNRINAYNTYLWMEQESLKR